MDPEPKINPVNRFQDTNPNLAEGEFRNVPDRPTVSEFNNEPLNTFDYQQNRVPNQPPLPDNNYNSPASAYTELPNQYAQPPYPQPMPQPPIQPQQTPNQTQAAAPPASTNPNSSQNALQIAEVRDGIVILNDGTFRSVIMIKPINFDLMSPQEKESVEYAYQGFLNSLFFPIQIFIHSERVDISPYINRLDKMRLQQDNMLLAVLMEDYLNFMVDLSQHTNIMDKGFYIIVGYSPAENIKQTIAKSKNFFTGLADLFSRKEKRVVINESDLAKAKDELRIRVQAILEGLAQCNIKGLPLDTQELIELYYDTYNPDTAVRQQLKNFNDLNPPVVTKGKGMAPQPNLDTERM